MNYAELTNMHLAIIAAAVAAFTIADLIFCAWVIAKIGKHVKSFLEHTLWR